MNNSLIVLLPPILVLIIAISTHSVLTALISGIISAAFIATNFDPINALMQIIYTLLKEANITQLFFMTESPDHLYTFGFLLILGIIISLITHTGGLSAYSKALMKKLKNKKITESASLIIALFFFIDDYLNSLTTGCIMRPLTDRLAIPRVKLAFLLDSMSAPLCVIIPASSWVAFILSHIETAGIKDPFTVYIHSIIYMFYPFLLIITTWLIVLFRISYGPMHRHEEIAEKTGNLFGGNTPLENMRNSCSHEKSSMIDFILPIGTFIGGVIALLLYTGNWHIFGGTTSFLQALQSANIFYTLFLSSAISLGISSIYFMLKNKLSLHQSIYIARDGFNLMKKSLIVLLLAWTLGSLLKDIQTGNYLAELLIGSLPMWLVPLMIFITTTIVSAATGSAWGAVNIMMPLAIPLTTTFIKDMHYLLNQSSLLYAVLGALISGAIAGGHISPISDSTVMSSTSSGSYHLDHLKTQFGYVIPPILGTMVALIVVSIYSDSSNIVYVLAAGIAGIITTALTLSILNEKARNSSH